QSQEDALDRGLRPGNRRAAAHRNPAQRAQPQVSPRQARQDGPLVQADQRPHRGHMSDLFFIGGPCVIESEAHALRHAKAIAEIARDAGVDYIYKSSYDKANRTSGKTYRGPGLKDGLAILAKVKKQTGVRVLTDV